MNIQDIINEVKTSKWQPQFEFTDNFDYAVDSILIPHEDYFLKLHDKVKEIILSEVEFAKTQTSADFNYLPIFEIGIREIFTYQKMLFDDKFKKVVQTGAYHLPNRYIPMGYRQHSVKLPNFVPPMPMYVPTLLENIIPVKIENGKMSNKIGITDLTEFYKVFQTIHPFDDLNGRVGGIVMNIISKLIFDKWIVNKEYLNKLINE